MSDIVDGRETVKMEGEGRMAAIGSNGGTLGGDGGGGDASHSDSDVCVSSAAAHFDNAHTHFFGSKEDCE